MDGLQGHTLRGCVDWNCEIFGMPIREYTSHPAWVCGLKPPLRLSSHSFECHTLRGCVDWNHHTTASKRQKSKSHPAWVCGLKQTVSLTSPCKRCHTLRGCVDWNFHFPKHGKHIVVTPCVGVWIETRIGWGTPVLSTSHPAWVCGLKLGGIIAAGASLGHTLRGCVDWNNYSRNGNSGNRWKSHPAWVCGLKLSLKPLQLMDKVTPCVGVWIETFLTKPLKLPKLRHTLRGCVDWNWNRITNTFINFCHTLRGCVDWNYVCTFSYSQGAKVTPCVGVWIETHSQVSDNVLINVTPCVGVWIETRSYTNTW